MSFQAIPPDRLFQVLNNTGLQNRDNPLYQLLFSLIAATQKLNVNTGSGGGGGGGSIVNNIITNVTQQIVQGDGGGGDGDSMSIPGPPGAQGAVGPAGPSGSGGVIFNMYQDEYEENIFQLMLGVPGGTGPAGANGLDGRPGLDGQDASGDTPFVFISIDQYLDSLP